MTRHILVLCSGNICRSPIAAALLARHLPGKAIGSAGLAAPVGTPADPMAIEFAAALGSDLQAVRDPFTQLGEIGVVGTGQRRRHPLGEPFGRPAATPPE